MSVQPILSSATSDEKKVFHAHLMDALHLAWENRYADNHPSFIKSGNIKWLDSDLRYLDSLSGLSFANVAKDKQQTIEREVEYKSKLYHLLNDEYSRTTLLIPAIYNILGYRHVKTNFWKPNLQQIVSRLNQVCRVATAAKKGTAPAWHLDMTRVGIDLRAHISPWELYRYLYHPSYEYHGFGHSIRVEPGDVVIDCGVYFGEFLFPSALKVGEKGKVIGMEPLENARAVIKHNRSLNPGLSERINIIPKAAWHMDGQVVSFYENSVGSRIIEQADALPTSCKTLSIDSAVRRNQLSRVDFIKMDIEGAELNALTGAKQTLSAFKPKLAISIYHKVGDALVYADYDRIVAFLAALVPDYKFYLDQHHYKGWTDVVLYASAVA